MTKRFITRLIISLIFLFLLVSNVLANQINSSATISLIKQVALEYDLNPQVLLKLAKVESNLNPKAISPNKVNFGLFQIHKRTGASFCHLSVKELLNPIANARCAARYLQSFYKRNHSYPKAVAEFNAGGWYSFNGNPAIPVNYLYVHRVLTLADIR